MDYEGGKDFTDISLGDLEEQFDLQASSCLMNSANIFDRTLTTQEFDNEDSSVNQGLDVPSISQILAKRKNNGTVEYLVLLGSKDFERKQWVSRKMFPKCNWADLLEDFESRPSHLDSYILDNETMTHEILEKRKRTGTANLEYLILFKKGNNEKRIWITRKDMPILNWADLIESFEGEEKDEDSENDQSKLNNLLELASLKEAIDEPIKTKRNEGASSSTNNGCNNAAKEQIKAFLQPPFQQLKNNYLGLKSNILREKNASEKYVDVDQMQPELEALMKECQTCFEDVEKRGKETKEKLKSSNDPNLEWRTAITFKEAIDTATKKLNDFEFQLLSIQKKYQTSPEAVLARKTKADARKTGIIDGIEKYKLPIKLVCKDDTAKIRRYDLGVPDFTKSHKTLMMVGMTGAGKSLMINNIINYVYGVSYADNFRFELIIDKEEIAERGGLGSKSKADSMTSWVTGFNLNYQEGFRVNFGLTIIDTPGFGDTRGIKYDEIIVDQIREFFQSDQCCPVKEISCVGFVIQASTARITDDQKYVFDQVLNVFGKDMSENVFLLFTFADAQPAPALEVVKSHQIPFAEDCVFKFNNSALFAPNTNLNSEYSWNFGYNSLQDYFHHVGGKTPTSLTQTLDVLEERDYLKLILEHLKPKIDAGMDILQSIENMIQSILELRGTAHANKDYRVTKTVHPQTTKVVDHYITNCKSCMFTCHDPCYIAGDNKKGCASMRDGKCGVCPGYCPWDMHSNGDRIYIYSEVQSEETIEDMCQKYNIATSDKNAKKKLLLNLFEEYKAYKAGVFEDISRAADAAKRLEEIALKNTFLTNVSYIERLVKAEEMSNRPNKKHRLEQLNDVLQKAKILEDAKNNPETLTGHVNSYEETILDKINNIEDEFSYDYSSYFKYTHSDGRKQNKKDKKSYYQSLKDTVTNINPWKW